MNQALAVMMQDEGLGILARVSSVTGEAIMPRQSAQPSRWAGILSAIGTALPLGVATYQAFRNPVAQPQQLFSRQAPQSQAEEDSGDEETSKGKGKGGINTNLGFDLNKGLNIGGTTIPILYLALGAGALFLLFKQPPRRGR